MPISIKITSIKGFQSRPANIGRNVEGVIGNSVEGEYKNFTFIVDPKDVIISNKISGDKPTRWSSKLK